MSSLETAIHATEELESTFMDYLRSRTLLTGEMPHDLMAAYALAYSDAVASMQEANT